MRDVNKCVIQESQTASFLLEQIKVIESFLGDFSFLVLGRDNIICRKLLENMIYKRASVELVYS